MKEGPKHSQGFKMLINEDGAVSPLRSQDQSQRFTSQHQRAGSGANSMTPYSQHSKKSSGILSTYYSPALDFKIPTANLNANQTSSRMIRVTEESDS